LTELQQQMSSDKQQQCELSQQLKSANITIAELEDKIVECYTREREASTRLLDLEATVERHRQEVGVAKQQVQLLRDQLIEKDGELTAARMAIDSSEKQSQQLISQVNCHFETYRVWQNADCTPGSAPSSTLTNQHGSTLHVFFPSQHMLLAWAV